MPRRLVGGAISGEVGGEPRQRAAADRDKDRIPGLAKRRKCLLARSGDAYWRARLLIRLGDGRRIIEAVVFALVGEGRLGPRPLDDLERLEKPLAAFRIRHAVGGVGSRVATPPDPKKQSALADLIDRGGLLGETQRVAERQDLDAGADLDVAGTRGNGAGDGQRRRQYGAARLLVDFGKPDRVEAPTVGGFDLGERLRERLRRGLLRPAVEFMVDANFHGYSPLRIPRRITVISI